MEIFLGSVSFLRRGPFVFWGGWGERKRERTGHAFSLLFPLPIVPRALFIFYYYCYFIEIPCGSFCGGQSGSVILTKSLRRLLLA